MNKYKKIFILKNLLYIIYILYFFLLYLKKIIYIIKELL